MICSDQLRLGLLRLLFNSFLQTLLSFTYQEKYGQQQMFGSISETRVTSAAFQKEHRNETSSQVSSIQFTLISILIKIFLLANNYYLRSVLHTFITTKGGVLMLLREGG